MSELAQLLQTNRELEDQLASSVIPDTFELFSAKPDLFSKEMQEAYFSAIEGFVQALLRKNSYKFVTQFRRNNPMVDAYLKTLPAVTKDDLIANIRREPAIVRFLQAVQNKRVSVTEYQEIVTSLLDTNISTDIIRLMSDYEVSFCNLLRLVFPQFAVQNNDHVTIVGFNSTDKVNQGMVVEAEWIIDQLLHATIGRYIIQLKYRNIPNNPRTDLHTLN